jgi:hypothetical protein
MLHQRSRMFAETRASTTGFTAQTSDRLVFTDTFDYRQVSIGKSVENGAVTTQAGIEI